MPPGGGGGSKLVFFDGQKDFGGQLFQPGGLFPSLLGGGPNQALEAQISRGQQGVAEQLSAQGLTGSGLAAKAISDFGVNAAGQRQNDLVRTVLSAIQPAGASSGGGGGLFSK